MEGEYGHGRELDDQPVACAAVSMLFCARPAWGKAEITPSAVALGSTLANARRGQGAFRDQRSVKPATVFARAHSASNASAATQLYGTPAASSARCMRRIAPSAPSSDAIELPHELVPNGRFVKLGML